MQTSYQEEKFFKYQIEKGEAEQILMLPVICGCCGEVFTAASFRRHYRGCPERARKEVIKKA